MQLRNQLEINSNNLISINEASSDTLSSVYKVWSHIESYFMAWSHVKHY